MTSKQKSIKYFAIALAVLIIIFIFSAIFTIGGTILESFGIINNDDVTENMWVISKEIEDIDELYIELRGSKLEIVSGNEFKVETNNSKVQYTADTTNKDIRVVEKGRYLFYSKSKNNSTVKVTIPEDIVINNKLYIKTGAGTINIEKINIPNIEFDLGASNVNIEELTVSESANIDGGVGQITILSGIINNLNVEMGVGEFNLSALLTGKTVINGGIGEFNLNLLDSKSNYTFKFSKGLGEIKFNDKKVNSEEIIGNGENNVYISGGIGEITVETTEINDTKNSEETTSTVIVNEE